MLSSLSFAHGNRAFRFQPNTNPNPISNQSPFRATKPPSFLSSPSTKPSPSPSTQLTLRSHSISQSPSLRNPKWALPSNSFSPTAATTKKPQSSVAPVRSGISSNSFSTNGNRSFRDWVEALSETVSTAFPLWVALGCLLGLLSPSSFNWVTPKLNFFGLTLTMFGMGMTLTFNDLRDALAMPKELFSGFVLQYSVSHSILYINAHYIWLPTFSLILMIHLLLISVFFSLLES